jgi:ferric-dicitrate binding protein FerR (iron transport regulator)
MTMDRYAKLSEWIIKEVEGTLTPEEFGCMKQLLSSDPQALDFYVNSYFSISFFMEPFRLPQEVLEAEVKNEDISDSRLWKALAEIEKSAETIEIAPSPPPIPQKEAAYQAYQAPKQVKRRVSRTSLAALIISTAALLLWLAYVYLNPRTANPIVGVLADVVDARWQDTAVSIQPGQDLRAGVLNLEQGLAHIRFDGGASVILEGPARVELLSGKSMFLRQGRIVATVDRDAVGFVVDTPQGKILDLGTEFGIQVKLVGPSQIHVFQGEVVLYPTNQDGRLKVSEGDAKSMDQSGKAVDIPLQAAAFVRQDEMLSKLLAHMGNSYYRWKAWVFDIHRDPSLVAHYFYAKDETQPESLLNATVAAKRQTGHFGGQGRTAPTWVTGRWPKKSAVRFERGKNQAIIIPPDPALAIGGPITVSTWVYYPNQEQMGGHLISCKQEPRVYFQFSVFDGNYVYKDQQNRFEFLRVDQQNDKRLYSGEFVQQAGVWYHFAVTHDMNNAYFYVNGRLFESSPCTASPDASAAEIIIGAIKINGSYVLPEGDFDGVVDELMIFNRCLNAGEIQKIYENGLP